MFAPLDGGDARLLRSRTHHLDGVQALRRGRLLLLSGGYARRINRSCQMKPQKILRLPEVIERSGYGRTQLDEKMEKKEFPPFLKLSNAGRAKGWLEDEVAEWQMWRKAVRDADPNLPQIEEAISWLRKPTFQAPPKSAAPPKRKNVAA